MKEEMKCLLMNKNTKIALINLNTELNSIDKIYEIYNEDLAPLSFKNAIKNSTVSPTKTLNNWYRGRGIPSWRKDLSDLLEKLNISSPDALLDKAYSLSLSDQYWIKEENQNIEWKDINFFTNDFKYQGFLSVSLSLQDDTNEEISLNSPNNTTDGMLSKAWIIEDEKRYLIKGTYSFSNQEPINEWLTSKICEKLGLDYCPYDIVIKNNKIMSKCECFINQNEEIISAYDIFMSEEKPSHIKDIEHYTNILEKHDIKDARSKIEDMFLVDYIVMNYDRHMKNYGVIRNVETGKWEKLTPIFDTGESLNCNKLTNEINFFRGQGKFFTNTEKDFFEYLDEIDLSKVDLSKLKDIPDIYKEKLIETKEYTDITIDRINKLVNGLEKRINDLSEYKKRNYKKEISAPKSIVWEDENNFINSSGQLEKERLSLLTKDDFENILDDIKYNIKHNVDFNLSKQEIVKEINNEVEIYVNNFFCSEEEHDKNELFEEILDNLNLNKLLKENIKEDETEEE